MAYIQGPYSKNERSQALQEAGLQNIMSGIRGFTDAKTNERAQALESLKFAKEQGYEASSPEFQEAYRTGDIGALGKLQKTQEFLTRQDATRKMLEMEMLAKQAELENKQASTKETLARTEKLINESKGGLTPEKKFEAETNLRKEINAEPEVRDFFTVRNMKDGVVQGAKRRDSVGDLKLIYSYMKLVDPNSSVKEGEVAMAKDTQNIPNQLVTKYNELVENKGKLSDQQRNAFAQEALSTYKSREEKVGSRFRFYDNLIKKGGLDAANIIYAPVDAQEQPVIQKLAEAQGQPAIQKPALQQQITQQTMDAKIRRLNELRAKKAGAL